MIIGIDLGTSTSEVAFVNENGQVVVIPNKEGEYITPSVVYMKRNGRSIVGREAGEYLFTRPESTFIEVKRKFGSDEKLKAHGKLYAPEEIQARIIEYMVECAEEFTGEKVTGAVITVPAYFTDIQRKQTIQAGTLAGVKVERVINEPTSAALDYGLQRLEECEHVLVYDFGGGTLDVTVLELFEGVIDVKSSCGNNRLGGKDFDEALMRHIAGKHYSELVSDPKSYMRLKQAAVEAKTALSMTESAKVRIPLITDDISIDMTITREEFDNLIRPMVESTGIQIDTALKDAGLTASDLDRVILVGGTTRVPLVRSFTEEKLGIETGEADENSPELMVVRGAAIQAAIIGGVIAEESSVVLTDVCPFTLGLKIVSSHGFKVDPLIQKNVTIPYEFSKIYNALHEYQSSVCIEVYQGESVHPQENTQIGSLLLNKLPRRQNELARAEVTFSYDVNGILNVNARSLGNDSEASAVIDINNNDMVVRPPVKLSEWEQAEGASKYRPLLRKANKILDEFIGTPLFVEEDIYALHDMVNDLKADLILGDKKSAEEKADEIRGFIEYHQDEESNLRMLRKLLDSFEE